MKYREHLIKEVACDSIAEEMGIESGDVLLSINDQEVEDVFDYRFMIMEEELEVLIRKSDGDEWLLDIEKDSDEDLGLIFDNGLMDSYKRCCNNCIFCFIDQMPKGMRETLYFKDDDSRLSFLNGNYVTLTNMSEHDIDRIIKYHLSPINISFQTTNPELRCKMLNNRFAGDALKKAERLYEAGIEMNGQIVLCKGINDGDELRRSFDDLLKMAPVLQSVSVVPVGLTRYREGLFPLEAFGKEDAIKVLEIVKEYSDKAYKMHQLHLFHASDEFYILADEAIPGKEAYDGYLQLENGVGMLRSMMDEYEEAYLNLRNQLGDKKPKCAVGNDLIIVTGMLAYPFVRDSIIPFVELFENLNLEIVPVRNDFFGPGITVTGLVTGTDIIAQLGEKAAGKTLLIPECMLRADEEVFLDDITLSELEKTLQVRAVIVKSSGDYFAKIMMGEMA